MSPKPSVEPSVEPSDDFSLSSEPKKRKPKAGHVNGSHPSQFSVEEFCVSVGLPKLDGELMLLKWNADGWPKNWMDKIRYWQRAGFMPSQKPQNGERFSHTTTNPIRDDVSCEDGVYRRRGACVLGEDNIWRKK